MGTCVALPYWPTRRRRRGSFAAEAIAGLPTAAEWKSIPWAIFTDPEISGVGLTEKQALESGYKIKKSRFSFAALGRAMAVGETDGFVRIVSEDQSGVVLGVQIVGPEASDLISEAALAIEMGATVEDLALTIHPHPTLPEAIMEAAESSRGKGCSSTEVAMTLSILDLGRRPYSEVWALQKDTVEGRGAGRAMDTLILVEHEHVVTLGRKTSPENLMRTLSVPVFQVERGGDATYHGPGQLVGYPIVKMAVPDVKNYVRKLEEVLVRTVETFDISAGRKDDHSGVWVGEKKLASIGVAVTNWVTYHGFTLNVNTT